MVALLRRRGRAIAVSCLPVGFGGPAGAVARIPFRIERPCSIAAMADADRSNGERPDGRGRNYRGLLLREYFVGSSGRSYYRVTDDAQLSDVLLQPHRQPRRSGVFLERHRYGD